MRNCLLILLAMAGIVNAEQRVGPDTDKGSPNRMNTRKFKSQIPKNADRSFKEAYPNPVISRTGTVIPGVEIWAVFDKSDEAKDPITQDHWISGSGDLKRLSVESVNAAMIQRRFFPNSEDAALALAELPFSGEMGTVVADQNSFQIGIPKPAMKLIDSPKIIRKGVGFIVRFDLVQNPSYRWDRALQEDAVFVTRYELEIQPAKGLTLRSKKSLWPPADHKTKNE